MGVYDSLKSRAYACNMELVRQRLVIHTFGNASYIDRERGVYAIKPSGVAYDRLSPEKMVVIDLDGRIVSGDLSPSSDTKTHTVLYNKFPHIGGVVHTHSTYAVAWAQAMRDIPIFGTTHADHLPCDIPCTKVMRDDAIKRDYEMETGFLIAERFQKLSYEEIGMVLVACHGPFTWGKTPEEAVYNSSMLEEIAKMAYISLGINPKLNPLKKTLIEKHYYRKHGAHAYYGQEKNEQHS